MSLIDNINSILTAPVEQPPMTSANIIEHIRQMGALLDEQNNPEERYLILPPAKLPNRKLKSRAWKKAFKKDIRNGIYRFWRPNKKDWYKAKIAKGYGLDVIESPHCDNETAYITKG